MKYVVIGISTGKQYYTAPYRQECFRWLNAQTEHGSGHSGMNIVNVVLAEPMKVVRLLYQEQK